MKQLKERFAIEKIKQLIPLSSKNSFDNVSHHFYHLKRQLNEQKYVHSYITRTEMSIGHTKISIFVHWRNRNVHWTFKCPFVQWTNGHCRMLNTSVSYPQGVMLDRITSLQQFWHCKSKMSIGQTEMSIGHSYVHSSSGRTEMSIGHKYMFIRPLDEQKCLLDIQMSIRPLDEHKCPLDIHMSIRPVDEQKCPLDINICSFVHWTSRNVYWTFKCPFVHWTNRNVHWTSKCPFVHWTNGRMDTV